MHHGFVAATVVLGVMPIILTVVAIVWYRRSARGGSA
jgi:hypothetical protein